MSTFDPVTVDANPYIWPYDGDIPLGHTALINIDWQVDFCGEGGYVDAMGYDLALTRTPLVGRQVGQVGPVALAGVEDEKPDLPRGGQHRLGGAQWRAG